MLSQNHGSFQKSEVIRLVGSEGYGVFKGPDSEGGCPLCPVAIFFILAHFFPVPTVPCSPTYACQCADPDTYSVLQLTLPHCHLECICDLTLPSPYTCPWPVFDHCFKLFQCGSVFGKWFMKCSISFTRLASSSTRLRRASKSKVNF